MHERGDVVDSESVDIAKRSPAVSEPTGAVAAVVAIDERSRHIIEQDGAARAAVRRDQREDGLYRIFRKVVGNAFPQEQRPRSRCIPMFTQCLAEIVALE